MRPSLNPSQWSGLWSKLLLVLLMPLFVLIAILAMPLVLLFQAIDHLQLRSYCWRHQVWTFLIVSKRRGWHEFVDNNIRPVVPADVALLWCDEVVTPGSPMRWLVSGAIGQGKPCLVQVTPFHQRARSIHNRLQSKKSQRHIDPALQTLLREILREELTALRGEGQRKALP